MKVNGLSFQQLFLNYSQAGKQTNKVADAVAQSVNSKETLKEMVMKQVEKIEEAKTNMGQDDPKAQRLIQKFNNGSKLTPEEMAYIRQNAPGMVEHIEKVLREREAIEYAMKSAPTKTDVQLVTLNASKQIEKHKDPGERIVRAKHLADAKHKYEQTEEYKNKPTTILDKKKKKEKVTNNADNTVRQSAQIAIEAYEKAKIKNKDLTISSKTI